MSDILLLVMLAKANLLFKEISLTMFVWYIIKSPKTPQDFHFKKSPKPYRDYNIIETCGWALFTNKHTGIVVANVAQLSHFLQKTLKKMCCIESQYLIGQFMLWQLCMVNSECSGELMWSEPLSLLVSMFVKCGSMVTNQSNSMFVITLHLVI